MVQLFEMACQDVQKLKNETLDNLIQFNRDLKTSYSSLKHSTLKYQTTTLPERLKETCKQLKEIKLDEEGLNAKFNYRLQQTSAEIKKISESSLIKPLEKPIATKKMTLGLY